MKNSHGTGRHLWRPICTPLRQTKCIRTRLGRINTVVTPVQRHDELAENTPYEALLCSLPLVLQVLNHSSEVAVPAVLHVQVKVLAGFEVLAVVVGDDIGVAQVREDLELGMELLALLLGHAKVRNLLAAHDEAVGLSAHFSNYPEGAMA